MKRNLLLMKRNLLLTKWNHPRMKRNNIEDMDI
jgi:hypothetical protein